MPRTIPSLLFVTSLCLVSIIAGGCSDDSSCNPDCRTAQIYGTVTGAGKPLSARVAVQSVRTDPIYPFARYDTETDSSGAFALDVAPGTYIVKMHIEHIWCCASGNVSGGTLSYADADTFAVGENSAPLRVDVALGAVRMRIAIPPQLGGEEIQGYLSPEVGYNGVYTFADALTDSVTLVYPAVSPGRYRMRVYAGGTGVWLPGSYSEVDAEIITIEAGKETVYKTGIPARGMVSGSVTGSWQRMNLERPLLRLYDPDSTEISNNIATWDGRYQLWILAPVRVRLAVWIGTMWRWYGGSRFEDAIVFDLHPGETTVVNIVENGVAGEIGRSSTNYRSGVDLCDDHGSPLATCRFDGETGSFRFPNLGPGTYFLRIGSGPSWIQHWYDRTESFEDATPITIDGGGQVVWVQPSLLEGGSISGEVLDPQSRPVIGAVVEVTSASDPTIWDDRQARTGEDGRFRMPSLPDGSFKLRASTTGRADVWYPGAANWDSAGVLTIAGHAEVTGASIQFR